MYELRPCPFCGYAFPTISKGFCGDYSVNCPNCNSIFRLNGTAGRDMDPEKTAAAWNSRPRYRVTIPARRPTKKHKARRNAKKEGGPA